MNSFKRKISKFFTYYGVLFLVIAALIPFGWHLILSSIDEVKDYEKISIFAETYGYDEKIEDDILSYLKINDDTKSIYEVNTYQFASDNSKIVSYYSKFGDYADIVILIEEDLIDMKDTIKQNFVEFDDELCTKYLKSNASKYDYYELDSKKYAIKLSDKNDSNYSYLNNYFTYKQDSKTEHSYYLLLNYKSVNIGKYKDDCKTNNALLTLTYLLGGN